MKPSRVATCIAAVTLAAAASPPAVASSLTVTLADFSRVQADRITIDGASLTMERDGAPQNGPTSVPLAELLAIEFVPTDSADLPATRPVDAFTLATRDDARLVGKPVSMEGDTLRWRSALLGEWAVPVQTIRSIVAAGAAEPAPGGASAAEDEVRLRNGDAVTGVVSGTSDTSLTVQAAGGERVSVDWSAIRAIRFTQTAATATAAPAAPFRVRLRAGSHVTIDGVTLSAGGLAGAGLTARWQGQRVAIDAPQLARLDLLAGRTRLLADRPPTSATYAPYFPRLATGAASDHRAPAIAATHAATSAISASPRSALTWALPTDVAGRAFHARYVIPAGLPRADVTVRVRADSRILYEREHVRSGETPPAIDVPLGDAKSLALEVDYGDGYDVQDEFYWLDAAIVATPKR